MNPPWQIVTLPPALGSGDLHIWRADLSQALGSTRQDEALLSQDELNRANRFHFPIHRNRFIAGRAHLRRILAGYLGTTPPLVAFSYSAYGRPSLQSADNPSAIEFNVSHSGDSWVLAAARERRLGIDVEQIRPDFGGEDIARANFAPNEFHELLSVAEQDRSQAFFNCWTRKEAYVKALGAGLQIPLHSFEVTLLQNEPARFRRGADDDWHLLSFLAETGYQAAIAYQGATATARFFELRAS
jgi:4'-phosphopantetheinyl transferase